MTGVQTCALPISVDLVCCEVKINCTVGAARKGNLIGQTISYCTGSQEINVDKHHLKWRGISAREINWTDADWNGWKIEKNE